jgi:hypothetical protein
MDIIGRFYFFLGAKDNSGAALAEHVGDDNSADIKIVHIGYPLVSLEKIVVVYIGPSWINWRVGCGSPRFLNRYVEVAN